MMPPELCKWCHKPGPFYPMERDGQTWWYHASPGCCGSFQIGEELRKDERGYILTGGGDFKAKP